MKTNHGKMFAICRGGTHHFRLPVAQAHDHPIVHIPLNPTRRNIGEEVSEEGTQKVCKYFIPSSHSYARFRSPGLPWLGSFARQKMSSHVTWNSMGHVYLALAICFFCQWQAHTEWISLTWTFFVILDHWSNLFDRKLRTLWKEIHLTFKYIDNLFFQVFIIQ